MTDNTRKDRQSRARERVKRAGGHRITVAISAEALEVLQDLCTTRGISQGQAVSYALADRDAAIGKAAADLRQISLATSILNSQRLRDVASQLEALR